MFANENGTFYQYINGLAIYERDAGILWRHWDVYNNVFQGRRGRQLVLTRVNAVGNYDYFFLWIFDQKGAITIEVQATGLDDVLLLRLSFCCTRGG